MQMFNVTAFYHGTVIFTARLSFLPRIGEQIATPTELFVIRHVRYILQEGCGDFTVSLFLDKKAS